jgi:S-sulfo-L-cysteine synthase (O-acetyl-L-serine-dependent)
MSITQLIGNTPMVKVQRLNPNPNVELWVKLEGTNPGGSVKDRAAYNMISQAIERGEIRPGMELIEATSGNTGIALAMVASMLGLKMTLVMPASATRERVLTMEAFGATVVLTDAKGGMEAAIDYANEKVATGAFFALNQFGNPDNWGAHYKGTGPEIWRDTSGKVTHFVSAMGTTGTIMGTSRFLKEQNPAIQIVGAQPTDGSSIPGIRRWPKEYLPAIFEPARVDRIIDVDELDARRCTQKMATVEGIFAGMSSGGAFWSALKLCEELESGVVVTIACDRGDRYLSSDLFERKV